MKYDVEGYICENMTGGLLSQEHMLSMNKTLSYVFIQPTRPRFFWMIKKLGLFMPCGSNHRLVVSCFTPTGPKNHQIRGGDPHSTGVG